MKRAILLAGAILVLVQVPTFADKKPADKKPADKVQVIVQSWLLPGTLASQLKSGSGITDIVIEEDKAAETELSDITKGEGDMPKMGTYHQQKMTVYQGEKYHVYNEFFSTKLPKGSKLKDFMLKGTFTAKMDGKAHKFALFEAAVVKP
jgi:hypothetical protein